MYLQQMLYMWQCSPFIAGIQQCPSVEAQDPVSQEVSWMGSAGRDRCMCCVWE